MSTLYQSFRNVEKKTNAANNARSMFHSEIDDNLVEAEHVLSRFLEKSGLIANYFTPLDFYEMNGEFDDKFLGLNLLPVFEERFALALKDEFKESAERRKVVKASYKALDIVAPTIVFTAPKKGSTAVFISDMPITSPKDFLLLKPFATIRTGQNEGIAEVLSNWLELNFTPQKIHEMHEFFENTVQAEQADADLSHMTDSYRKKKNATVSVLN